MKTDVAIVGAGPAGLCLARALDRMGLDIHLFDGSQSEQLADPVEDGREIALTHTSRAVLERLGIWQRLDPSMLSELRDVAVFDGESSRPMRISHADGGRERLGTLVSRVSGISIPWWAYGPTAWSPGAWPRSVTRRWACIRLPRTGSTSD